MCFTFSFHRIVARIHARGEGTLKSIETFSMSEFRAVLVGFLLRGNFGGGFFLGCGTGLALLHSTAHGAGNRPRASTFASVTRDGPYGRAACGATSSAFEAASARRIGVFCCGLLFGLFLFGRFAGWSGSFRINSGLLLSGTVAIGLVFQLLIGGLTILSKYENADVLGG
jgi:hypothetical protein